MSQAAGAAMRDPERRAALAEAATRLLPSFPADVSSSLPVALVAVFVREGPDALAAGVISAWTASAAWTEVEELLKKLAEPGGSAHAIGDATLLALARAAAFVKPALAERLLQRLRAKAVPSGPTAADVDRLEALLRAVADVPAGQVAARRALGRIAVEHDWRPDAWGRDHGALVSIVKSRCKSSSPGFRGPLMQYLTSCSSSEMTRIAKKAGAGSGGAAWVQRGSGGPPATPGQYSKPDANWDRARDLNAEIEAAAQDREADRLRTEGEPPPLPDDAKPARPPRERWKPPPQRAPFLGGILSPSWWFPLLVLILGAILAFRRLF